MKRIHLIVVCGLIAVLLGAVGAAWAAGWVDVLAPWRLAVLLALPLLAVGSLRSMAGLPSHVNAAALAVRCLVFLLLAFGLADIQMVLRGKDLCVFFLLDHSASIPAPLVEQELRYVNDAMATKDRNATAGIVVFGEDASVEVMPDRDLRVERIYSAIGRDYTDLGAAVEMAVAAFPDNVRKKIVLVSDGNENKGNVEEAARFAAANRVVVEALPVTYAYEREVMVENVHVPDRVERNETFDLRVLVSSLQRAPAELSVYRNGACVARQAVDVEPGRAAFSVPLKIEEPGFYTFSARLATTNDTIAENNEATGYVYVQGASRVLFVAPAALEIEALSRACGVDNLETEWRLPREFPDTLGELQNYDCLVLANTAADELTPEQQAMIQAAVRDFGIGLIMIGGENSFGAGGYEGSPVEEALPVTMDIRQKKIMPKGALVLVLHTCEFANGNYWAKEISKKAIETVSPQDDVGVLYYGGGEQWLFELQPARDKKAMFAKVDAATPGDMPSFEPTLRKALAALSRSDAMIRHVIIISDGDPAGPPPPLVKELKDAGITISTVAINPHSPRDVDVMRYLAYQTGGRYYFADDPTTLPQIFVKEAKVVRRSVVFNQPFRPRLAAWSEMTKGLEGREIPRLMAYVATTPKPRAVVSMVSDNENEDPILAAWNYGLGKAVAFTSDASSRWGQEWLRWDRFDKLWAQIVRWSARKRQKSNLRLRTEIEGGRGRLIVDAVDAQGRFVNFLRLDGRIVSPDNKGATVDIRQTSPGRYEGSFDARQTGVSLLHVAYRDPQTGEQGFAATGVAVPCPLEFRKLDSDLPRLRRIAAATGGRMLNGDAARDRVFTSSLPPAVRLRPLWEYLLAVAFALFFLDVAMRRVVLTRDDLIAAVAAARQSWQRLRHPAAEKDRTLTALLDRKERTVRQVAPVPSAELRKTLQRAARTESGPPVAASGAEASPRVIREPPRAAAPKGDAYMDRLLAAKKRARTKPESKKEGGEAT